MGVATVPLLLKVRGPWPPPHFCTSDITVYLYILFPFSFKKKTKQNLPFAQNDSMYYSNYLTVLNCTDSSVV